MRSHALQKDVHYPPGPRSGRSDRRSRLRPGRRNLHGVRVLGVDDAAFLNDVSDSLASLPSVDAVTLGGSRAQGTDRADSDWDLAIYYRGTFNPQVTTRPGWTGDVSEIGGWGGGVFNGGAWLTIEGRSVDIHYRDLDVVEAQIHEAAAGRFHIEPLMFHLAGVPSYLVVGELAINQVLKGTLPAPAYPEPLRLLSPRCLGATSHPDPRLCRSEPCTTGTPHPVHRLARRLSMRLRPRHPRRTRRMGHQREDTPQPRQHDRRRHRHQHSHSRPRRPERGSTRHTRTRPRPTDIGPQQPMTRRLPAPDAKQTRAAITHPRTTVVEQHTPEDPACNTWRYGSQRPTRTAKSQSARGTAAFAVT